MDDIRVKVIIINGMDKEERRVAERQGTGKKGICVKKQAIFSLIAISESLLVN